MGIWNELIEEAAAKKKVAEVDLTPPYVHPLRERSRGFLTKESLEVCTENLGSETGSDGFSDGEGCLPRELKWEQLDGVEEVEERKGLAAVNYHCSMNMRSSPRSFPPPLPSISRRDGQCFSMRTHRQGGRLVVEAVPVPSQNYLHCEREGGRLVLSFIETAFEEVYPEFEGEEDGEVDVEEEQEKVAEVVDGGAVVEVKVSRQQPQVPNWGVVKVHRSFLVINKFASEIAAIDGDKEREGKARDLNGGLVEMGIWGVGEKRMWMSSKGVMVRSKGLLHQVRRCSEGHRVLFLGEPLCIASS